MKPKITALANLDDALIIWSIPTRLPGLAGFALQREWIAGGKPQGTIEWVLNRTGFEDQTAQPGETRPSGEWPFQRFFWTDHEVNTGDVVRYRVWPLLFDASGQPTFDEARFPASNWTAAVSLQPQAGSRFECFFNRGLLMSQFMARYLQANRLSLKQLLSDLRQHQSKIRQFLAGELRVKLVNLLEEARLQQRSVYAALYELSDAELIDALCALGPKAEVILANGSDTSGDGNIKARKKLNDAQVKVTDRMLKSKGLGHNKFVVFCGANAKPAAVWTGSTNWAATGLCTQINNGIYVADAKLAGLYFEQWNALQQAQSDFPAILVESNSKPRDLKVGKAPVTVWFTRTKAGQDMGALKQIIYGAKEGILFLMFTPGKDGLDHTIAERLDKTSPFYDANLYIHGLISTISSPGAKPSTGNAEVAIVARSGDPNRYTFNFSQPEGVKRTFAWWIEEVTRKDYQSAFLHAIVHSKILVVDPFGKEPVVVTGSHNFSAPASLKNDENFLIVRGNRALARSYAVHIKSVYDHYRWRAYLQEMEQKSLSPWRGLKRNDHWQNSEFRAATTRERQFWQAGS